MAKLFVLLIYPTQAKSFLKMISYWLLDRLIWNYLNWKSRIKIMNKLVFALISFFCVPVVFGETIVWPVPNVNSVSGAYGEFRPASIHGTGEQRGQAYILHFTRIEIGLKSQYAKAKAYSL